MKRRIFLLAVISTLVFFLPAWAHFGMVIPSDSMVMQDDARSITLDLSFSHPFEMVGMPLVTPKVFGVATGGQTADQAADLLKTLKPVKIMEHDAWNTVFPVKRPGVYTFFMEPQPYWEPAEDCYIIHYTKTVVTAFGDDEGWDGEIGLKTEIVPLSKPFGLYTGNVFQGIVKRDGKPMPFAEVEVEYYNQNNKFEAPTDYMVTQTIKADANGVFTYAASQPGWWGFAALSTADFKIPFEGQEKDVEIGAVIWVKVEPWKTK